MKEMNPFKQPGSLQAVQATLYDGYTQAVSRAQSMPKLALAGAMAVAAISGIVPHDVMAAIPTANTDVLPDAITGTDSMTQGVQLGTIILRVVFGFLTVLALLIPLAAIIKAFRERKGNDNDNFQSTVVGGLLVMALGMGLGITGFTFSGGLAAQILTLGA